MNRGVEGGLVERELINFPPLKRGGLSEGGEGAYLRREG